MSVFGGLSAGIASLKYFKERLVPVYYIVSGLTLLVDIWFLSWFLL